MPGDSITLIVVHRSSPDELASCLQSLEGQTFRNFDAVVIDAADGNVKDGPDEPERIGRALLGGSGDIVALTDSRCTFPPEWLGKLAAAHRSAYLVVGGAVEYSGPGTTASWAAYFADYGDFMPQKPRRETGLLAGNHVSYKKALIDASADMLAGGYRKVFFNWDLERKGIRFLFEPSLQIRSSNRTGVWSFARLYYRSARSFAGLRTARMNGPSRAAHILFAPLLPPLLLYRRFASVWTNGRRRSTLLMALPWLGIFVTCWSAGELAGYLAGRRAGSACGLAQNRQRGPVRN